jgi:hypothetical protein
MNPSLSGEVHVLVAVSKPLQQQQQQQQQQREAEDEE